MGPRKKQRKSAPIELGPDGQNKCHVACGEICLKLPGSILGQLTAGPLNTIKRLEITSDLKKVHIKILLKNLCKATALDDIKLDDWWSGNFSEVAEEMAVVLGSCRKIEMKKFKESPEFWQKCMTAARNNCKELIMKDCNGLDILLSKLVGFLPQLSRLELIHPYLTTDQEYESSKQLFCAFLQQKNSEIFSAPSSSRKILKIDNLWGLLQDVPPQTLGSAFAPLGSLTLCETGLHLRQLIPLVRAWAVSAPSRLSVESDWGSWNQVPSKLLVPAVSRISTLSFKGTKLSPKVTESLLSTVAGGCAVNELDLRGNDMSTVSRGVLVAAVARLQVAVFTQCGLAKEAVVGVLEVLAEGEKGKLDELHMTKVHPSFEKFNKEDKLVAWAKEGSGIGRLEMHSKQCKCDGYCSWY